MKRTLILLLLVSFSIQLSAMGDSKKSSRKRKLDEVESKEKEELSLNQQFIKAIEAISNALEIASDTDTDALENASDIDTNYEKMKIALENGADPNTLHFDKDNRHIPALNLLQSDHDIDIDMIKVLVYHPKINLDATMHSGDTAL